MEKKPGKKPLRAVISGIDQEILRLLVKRTNLLAKMRVKGRLPPEDEKYLREAWQNDVARVSRDPELSGRFFSLLQQISFLPKPDASNDAENHAPGAQRRQAFNLAPSRKPVHIALTAPLSGWQTTAWLYLAALAGAPLKLSPCLQNDSLVDYVRGLAQIGAAITREGDAILCRQAPPLPSPDKVIHAGQSEFSLYVFIAHYIGRHSRVKISGDANLRLADLSGLRHFLPELGARLINIVPRSAGLPIRIESSGALPAGITPDPALPAQFIEALLLAAPGYQAPFGIDLEQRRDKETILSHVMPLLEQSGAVFALTGSTVSIEPSELLIPAAPGLAVEPEIAAFLLAFPFALGGECILSGNWPDWPESAQFWELAGKNGFEKSGAALETRFSRPAETFCSDSVPASEWQAAFQAALAACACLSNGTARLPAILAENENVVDFLRITGLALASDGLLEQGKNYEGMPWNAPSPAWAAALAVAACCRKSGLQLGNPGIMTELWPPFWSLYNNLPNPEFRKTPQVQPEKSARRRILTDIVATPPEMRDEDLD